LLNFLSLNRLVELLGDTDGLNWVSLGILFHELVDLLSVGLMLDQSLSVLKSLDKDVDLLVQLGEVDLHVFLLRLGVLSLLIRVETIHLVLLSWISSEILIELSLLLVVLKDLNIKILDFWILSETDLLEISLRVGVLLSHESLSTLKSLSLNVVSSLWEEVAKVVKFILVHAHKDDIWERLHWLRLGSLLASTFVGVWIVL
jgi:hypothetical protein